MTERRKRAIATRNALVEAALKLIGSRGYDNVTVEAITAECGVAKGTFYHYFKSKDDILRELSGSLYDSLGEAANSGGSVLEQLTALVRAWYADLDEYNLRLARETLRLIALDSADGRQNGVTQMERGIGLMRECLERSAARGELSPDAPVETLSRALMFAMQGSAVYHCVNGGGFDVPAWCDEFLKNVLEPLLRRWLAAQPDAGAQTGASAR